MEGGHQGCHGLHFKLSTQGGDASKAGSAFVALRALSTSEIDGPINFLLESLGSPWAAYWLADFSALAALALRAPPVGRRDETGSLHSSNPAPAGVRCRQCALLAAAGRLAARSLCQRTSSWSARGCCACSGTTQAAGADPVSIQSCLTPWPHGQIGGVDSRLTIRAAGAAIAGVPGLTHQAMPCLFTYPLPRRATHVPPAPAPPARRARIMQGASCDLDFAYWPSPVRRPCLTQRAGRHRPSRRL